MKKRAHRKITDKNAQNKRALIRLALTTKDRREFDDTMALLGLNKVAKLYKTAKKEGIL